MEKNECYKKITELLLDFEKVLFGSCRSKKSSALSTRQANLIEKEYGSQFSKSNILFAENFLIFAGNAVAQDAMRIYSFNEDVCKNHILELNSVAKVEYSIMPLHLEICLVYSNGVKKKLYNGLPRSNSYSDVKNYVRLVESGNYKNSTVWMVAVIYALKTMKMGQDSDYQPKYNTIKENLSKLLMCCKKGSTSTCFYGDFPSFDLLKCIYSPHTVESDLEQIYEIQAEAKEEAKAERQEKIYEAVEKGIERTAKRVEDAKNERN